jgi:hypothetical protein
MRQTRSHVPLAEIDRSAVEIDCFWSLYEAKAVAGSVPETDDVGPSHFGPPLVERVE